MGEDGSKSPEKAISTLSSSIILPKTVVRYDIPIRKPSYPYMELYGALVAAISFLCCGTVQSYTSGAIYSIQSDHVSNISLSQSDIAWIASAPPLASLLGTVIAGPLMEKLGRRYTLTFLAVPFIIGWIIIGSSVNFAMIFAGRISGGVALGMSKATAPVYVSETARPKHRGKLGYLNPIMAALGVLVGCMLSSTIHWKSLADILILFPITLFVASFFLIESPQWLIRHNQEEKAYQNLKKLRSCHGNINDDFRICKEIAEIRESIDDTSPFPEKNNGILHLLQKPNIRYPATLIFLLMILQQFSGVSAVIYYLKMILNHGTAGGIPHPPPQHQNDIRPTIVGFVHFFSFFISLPLVDKLGRKILLKISGVLMALAHLVLSAYLYYSSSVLSPASNSSQGPHPPGLAQGNGNDSFPAVTIIATDDSAATDFTSVHSLLPLLCLCFYIASFSVASPVPYILMSEIFGNSVRSYLCSASMFFMNFSSFLVVLMFPALMYEFNATFVFVFFAMCSLGSTTIGYIIPETKGKSLAEIENLFRGPRDFHGKVKEIVEVPSCTAQYRVDIASPQGSSSATGGSLARLEKY